MRVYSFIAKHRAVYVPVTAAGIALVLAFATTQMSLVYGGRVPHNFYAIPLLLGTLIGLLMATLVALRREVLDGQRMFRAVADLAQEFVYIRRVDGTYEYVSPSCLNLTGYETEAFYAHPNFMGELIHPDDRPLWDGHVKRMHALGQPEKLELRIRTRDGKERWIQHLCSDVRDDQGNIISVRSANLDITERIMHERELALAAVAFETHEAIIITDHKSRILRVNRAFSEISGYSADEVIGHTPALLKSGRHDAQFYADMWHTLQAEGRWAGELWDRRKNGEIYPKFLTITAVPGASGAEKYYVGTFSDITVRKAAEDEINRLAYYDPLTKLPNRRLLLDRLRQALGASERNQRHGAVLFIDLDRFKNLNDTRGHEVGDQLLIEVAHRLRSSVRVEDTVARLGDDEFVVMLEDLDVDQPEAAAQAEVVANKMLGAVNQPYHLKGRTYECSSSIGATLFCGQMESIDNLLRRADVALTRAKEAGRAVLRFFEPAMQALLDARATLEADLRTALAQQQFRLYYQAQVDASGRVLGAEALLRWLHPERGLVMPGAFIAYAEECRLIIPIGRWVLEDACRQLGVWAGNPATRHLQLAVNISAHQFLQPEFVDATLQLVEMHRIDPKLLKLELTESALIGNIDEAIEKMQVLKAAGIRFSLDDFGTGYSSLSYLRRLPLDQLKIDRSFVIDIDSSSGATIARTIIGMGLNLGLDVIAEGVETREQFDFLEQHGCHAYQGYLFARPVPLSDFEALLAAGTVDQPAA